MKRIDRQHKLGSLPQKKFLPLYRIRHADQVFCLKISGAFLVRHFLFLKSLRLVAAATLFLGFTAATFASGKPYAQIFANKNATGEDLARAYFDLLTETGSPAGAIGTTPQQDEASKALVRPYLDSAFLTQRASGARYNASTFLPADVDKFEISDVRTTRPSDDVVVVRYAVRTTETLPDASLVMSKGKAPRLTVFHWNAADARWKLLSHANFNTPVAAICDRAPQSSIVLTSSAKADDQALGERLIGTFYDLVMKGDSAPILNPQIQFQSASGVGYTTLAERTKSTRYEKITFSKTVVTRSGRLLVVSTFNATEQRTLMQDNQLRASEAGNLSTFIQGPDGQWSMIAVAAFAPAQALPAGVECVKPGPIEKAP